MAQASVGLLPPSAGPVGDKGTDVVEPIQGIVTSPCRHFLIALLATAAFAGCASQKKTLKSEAAQPSPLAVSDVQKAFAAEGLALDEAPFDESSGPVTLVSHGRSPLFAAIVYGPSSVSAPLGIRVTDSHHLVVRVRNVVISYSATASTTAEVQAAVERLRRSKKR
jgi:hypothetical protein